MDENYLKELDALRELYSKESELNTEKVVKLTPEDIEEKKSMQLRIYEQGRKQYHLEKSNRSATYKIPEIAEVMDCPVGTVRSRIFRAREAVEKKIKPLLQR